MSTTIRTRSIRRKKSVPARRRISFAGDRRKVLLAVDGTRASNAAIRLARILTQQDVWAPHAITVAQAVPTYVGDFMLPAPPVADEIITNNVLIALRTQLRRHGLPDWPTNVRIGPTNWSILESAHEFGAQLIVVGLGKHGRLARLFGAETAGRVARKSDVPVLAVHPKTRDLPRVVVAAVDFGDSSVRALREALNLLEPGGELHLVHVMSSVNFTPVADEAWRLSYADAVEKSFERLRHTLGAAQVKTRLLTGQVAAAVAKYAKSVRADLIAAGSHNEGLVERVLLGSVPTELLRESPCSVLIAPPPKMESKAGA